MASKKIETCGLTKTITVNTRRKDAIAAMNPQRPRTLDRKRNSNALIILECHAFVNSVALRGALVEFKQVNAKDMKEINEMAKNYAGTHPGILGGGCNSNSKIVYEKLPDMELPKERGVSRVGVQWPKKNEGSQCRDCIYVFKRGGPNELMEHTNKVHGKDSTGDEYSRFLPLSCVNMIVVTGLNTRHLRKQLPHIV